MKNKLKFVYLILSSLRLPFHLIIFNIHKQKDVIKYDVNIWLNKKEINNKFGEQIGFLYLMTFYPEYRNLFYKRIGGLQYLIKILCKPLDSLFIYTKNIGPGLYIQHGFSTIITAKSIGANCSVNQQVTVGYNGLYAPVIGDNVSITSGAKVIGKVKVGNNSVVGANAVVVKDVPDNCVVVGVPAYIVKKNGVRVYIKL